MKEKGVTQFNRQETLKRKKQEFLPYAVGAIALTALAAIACKTTENQPFQNTSPTPDLVGQLNLDDITGDGIITIADYCILKKDTTPCADTNNDGVVSELDKALIEASVGTLAVDQWRDLTGDSKTTCSDLALVEEHLGQKSPLEISEVSTETLRNGWKTNLLTLEFRPSVDQEKFLEKWGLEKHKLPPHLQEVRPEQIVVLTNSENLNHLIEKLSQETDSLVSVKRTFLARPIIPIPSTPVATCTSLAK